MLPPTFILLISSAGQVRSVLIAPRQGGCFSEANLTVVFCAKESLAELLPRRPSHEVLIKGDVVNEVALQSTGFEKFPDLTFDELVSSALDPHFVRSATNARSTSRDDFVQRPPGIQRKELWIRRHALP